MITQLTIQGAAQETGLSTHTLRWYEKIGLIPYIKRAPNGHRRYTNDNIQVIRFITRLRETGMPLEEIKRYIDHMTMLHFWNGSTCFNSNGRQFKIRLMNSQKRSITSNTK